VLDERLAADPALERYLRRTGKIVVDDLDWDAGARVGLSDDEVFALTYFADIESQTFRYLGALLAMQARWEPAAAAFLTTWSYEEFFHGRALARLLRVAGHALPSSRVEEVGAGARANERLERLLGPLAARLFARQFPAVHMTFGAVHELTTLRGYERLAATTHNPVLRGLCQRIARQERRHFAWYFNHARAELRNRPSAQRVTRAVLRLNWVPVGAGVKSDAEVLRLYRVLFPGAIGTAVCVEIDQRIGSLPGLEGLRLLRGYFGDGERVSPPRLAGLRTPLRLGLSLLGARARSGTRRASGR
jgi:rubrerythrin